jgi:hypothetical protein
MSRTTLSGLRRVIARHPVITAAISVVVVATVVVTGSGVLPAWGAAIAGGLWLAWRCRPVLGARGDGPAALLAAAVALIPPDRRDWGAAMTAELAGISGRSARWAFAVGCARAALFPPSARARPATGWMGGAVGLAGSVGCIVSARYMVDTYPSSTDAVTPLSWALLVAVPVVGLLLAVAAPPALSSSAGARHLGLWFGVATGVGLYLFTRAGLLASGAATFLLPMQFVALAVLPSSVARVTRSRRAGVQTIVWGYVFGTLATFPVYVVESIRYSQHGGGLYLDGETLTNIGTNLDDAVLWLFLVGPIFLVPFGVAGVVLGSRIGRADERAAPPA